MFAQKKSPLTRAYKCLIKRILFKLPSCLRSGRWTGYFFTSGSFMLSNSTSKISAASPGIIGGLPCSP